MSVRSERQRLNNNGRRSPPQAISSPVLENRSDFVRPQAVRVNSADIVDRWVYMCLQVSVYVFTGECMCWQQSWGDCNLYLVVINYIFLNKWK